MPDYVYLLENRLSPDQRHALIQMREAAREAGMVLFLTGDAVRDLTSGHAVRSLEVSVHGNALNLKKKLVELGASIWGEHAPSQTLYLCFPGTVRVDLVSTLAVSYAKPGKPVYASASIQEELRRRDFTVNAMAISLNEGSYGLFMDPLNGAADVEARTLRLVSNYGFIEAPALLIRATRYRARLGWELDPRSQMRYDNARADECIQYLNEHGLSQELEQIAHEEDALTVLRALEGEGWLESLFPAWTSAKADEEKLRALHDLAAELQTQGIFADTSAAQMQLLTAKLSQKDLSALKKLLLRPGFVEEWDHLDQMAADFQKLLLAKENQTPSVSYKLFTTHDPESVLWLGFTSKSAAVQERYRLFLKDWPEFRQKVPYGLMAEMRITAALPIYAELVQEIFLALLDGKLASTEEMKALLEPHSPPAPPPQITIKRSRRKTAKVKEESFDDDEDSSGDDDDDAGDEDLDDIGGSDDEPDMDLDLGKDSGDDDAADADSEDEDEPAPKASGKKLAAVKEAPKAAKADKSAKKAEENKPEAVKKAEPEKQAKAEPVKAKVEAAKPKVEAKKPVPVAKPAAKAPAKVAAKAPAVKAAPAVKTAPAKAAAKPAPAKAAAKKPAPKAGKKH